jgi:hypothetical protein
VGQVGVQQLKDALGPDQVLEAALAQIAHGDALRRQDGK